jgi:hypothetical protein
LNRAASSGQRASPAFLLVFSRRTTSSSSKSGGLHATLDPQSLGLTASVGSAQEQCRACRVNSLKKQSTRFSRYERRLAGGMFDAKPNGRAGSIIDMLLWTEDLLTTRVDQVAVGSAKAINYTSPRSTMSKRSSRLLLQPGLVGCIGFSCRGGPARAGRVPVTPPGDMPLVSWHMSCMLRHLGMFTAERRRYEGSYPRR